MIADLQRMDRRAVGVAVDHGVHAVAHEGGLHFGRCHVGDGLEAGAVVLLHFRLARLAGIARFLREGDARGQRLRQELRLEHRVAGLRAELLVGHVVGAQQVAVLQQHRATVQVDHAGVGQDAEAGTARVVVADQEVAVAADEVHRHAGIGHGMQRDGHRIGGRGGRVIADPGFEQIAQDVQGLGLHRFIAQEGQEQVGDGWTTRVQVQIGDEQRGHAHIVKRDHRTRHRCRVKSPRNSGARGDSRYNGSHWRLAAASSAAIPVAASTSLG